MSMPAGEPCDYEVAPDMTLRGERFGSPQAPPLVLLHGGGQTRHAWGEAGPALARRGWQVLAIDSAAMARVTGANSSAMASSTTWMTSCAYSPPCLSHRC